MSNQNYQGYGANVPPYPSQPQPYAPGYQSSVYPPLPHDHQFQDEYMRQPPSAPSYMPTPPPPQLMHEPPTIFQQPQPQMLIQNVPPPVQQYQPATVVHEHLQQRPNPSVVIVNHHTHDDDCCCGCCSAICNCLGCIITNVIYCIGLIIFAIVAIALIVYFVKFHK